MVSNSTHRCDECGLLFLAFFFFILALQNPEVVALRGGLNTILKNVIDCQLSRINEALITTILHLLNHPKTRQYVRADVELERILAPYTDFHYRHSPDTAEGQLK
ncbi:hypothetical protein J1605_023010 [Eschrichtius robustus]|uniref:Rapamycin-insensitive companion of mTOR N-terminal domain-containing protein n=1 Tax=Eschrichtius robustus TaxID=9764 RepID=A0AB34H9B4_ESCRO|nr:hypothetical protein J1605_023010 [Eschrichtius robustus]